MFFFSPARSTHYYIHYRCDLWKSGSQINFLQDVWITKIVSMHMWEFYHGGGVPLTASFNNSHCPPSLPPPAAPFVPPFFCVPSAVDDNTWAQVIGLYPTLVECITCTSSEVSSALKEALGPFKDFMQPPVARVQNGET